MMHTSAKAGWLAVCLLVVILPSACSAEIEDVVQKSFPAQPGGKLVLVADRGSVEVQAAAISAVEVRVLRTARTDSRSEADTWFKEHELRFSQNGGTVTVESEFSGSWLKNWSHSGDRVRVRFAIRVPEKFDVDLKTSGGSVAVSDLAGEARAETSGGSLRFGRIRGRVTGKTSGGSITLEGGGGSADLRTSGGGIHVGDVGGPVEAHTSGGSIEIRRAAGAVNAETSGGGISVEEVMGDLNADTSGGSITATLSRQPAADCRLKTSGGGISVTLPDGVRVHVDARTSGGRVSTDFPVSVRGELSKTELDADINGGGPLLRLHTSGGSIHIRKTQPAEKP